MADKKDIELVLCEHEGTFHYEGTKFQEVLDLKCRDDDVWVCSYPRSGTTLTQQTVYLILTLDFDKASTIPIEDRFPMIEIDIPGSEVIFRGPGYVDQKPEGEPRMIKSHLHYRFLPKELRKGKGKMIYILRNPRATMLSMYKILKYVRNYQADCTLREFLERFLTKQNIYACPWSLHVREYWEHRNDENVLFLQFENTVKDRHGTIREIAAFLGVDLTNDQVDKIVAHTTLEAMKNNKGTNFAFFENVFDTDTTEGGFINTVSGYISHVFDTDTTEGGFINTGEISGWKQTMPEDLAKRFDEFVERELGDTDITFPE